MARANRRGGFGVLRGATNNRSGISSEAPNNPNNLDRWVDKDNNQEYYWNKPTTEWIPLFGAGGGGNLGGLVYHNDTNTTAVSTNVEVGAVDVTMAFDGSLVVTGTFVGTASAAMTLTTLIKLDTVTQHTIVDYVSGAVDHTVNFSVVLEEIVAGDYTVSVDMAANTGTFTLDASEQHLYCLTYYDAVIGGSSGSGDLGIYLSAGVGPSGTIQDTDEYNPDTWTSKTDCPTPARGSLDSSAISNKVYIYCGFTPSTYYQDTDEYTPDTWTNKTDCPSPGRFYHSATTINNIGYISSGRSSSSTFIQDTDEYNPDTWTSKTDCPTPARRESTFFSLTSGYLVAGLGTSFIQDNDEYNPDTWTNKTNCPSPGRRQLASFSLNSLGYIVAGSEASTLQDTDEYNPDTWTSKTDCPTPSRNGLKGSNFNNLGYIFCGIDGLGTKLQDTDEYNSIGDSWTSKTDCVSPVRNGMGCSTI